MERVGLNNKVFTENPLLDEIIYNTRQIIYGGIVIKDSDLADNCETLESVKNGDLLVNINNGNIPIILIIVNTLAIKSSYNFPLIFPIFLEISFA